MAALPVPFDPKLAQAIVERVSQGELVQEICTPDQGMPSATAFYRWVLEQPEVASAFHAARELSALGLEEEAIKTGRAVAAEPGTGQNVRAHDVLMGQLRWSAERRAPKVFGTKAGDQVVIPIQIVTSLDLRAEGGTSTKEFPNIYELEAVAVLEGGETVEERLTEPKARAKRGRPRKKAAPAILSVKAESHGD